MNTKPRVGIEELRHLVQNFNACREGFLLDGEWTAEQLLRSSFGHVFAGLFMSAPSKPKKKKKKKCFV
jgi:hypothetical protein